MGLSIAEYNALTPLELRAELEACRKIEEAGRTRLDFQNKLFDAHCATIEMLIHNAHYKRSARIVEFKLIEEKQKTISMEVMNFNVRMLALAQANLRKKGKLWD